MAYIFFDQNVMEKMSKKSHKLFQDNVDRLLLERTWKNQQLLTPFSLLEFSGYNPKEVLDIQYKNKKLTEYPFQSYDEFDNNLIEHIKKQICEKITKSSLKENLEEKKSRESKYLNESGDYFIDSYIKKIDLMYDDLIDNLFLDQLSQINTSRFFQKEDKNRFINLCTKLVIHKVCETGSMGSFRMVCKLYNELRKQPIPKTEKGNSKSRNIHKEIP